MVRLPVPPLPHRQDTLSYVQRNSRHNPLETPAFTSQELNLPEPSWEPPVQVPVLTQAPAKKAPQAKEPVALARIALVPLEQASPVLEPSPAPALRIAAAPNVPCHRP